MNKPLSKIFFTFALLMGLLASNQLEAQEYFRIKGNFSVKSKGEEKGNLTMGHFYYDASVKTLVYKITFPEPETWVFKDTKFYQIMKDSVFVQDSAMGITEFTVFHLVLNNQLSHYGLKNSIFKLSGIVKDKDQVITTWTPPKQLEEYVGKVLISNQNKKLKGIVFFNPGDTILRKQIFHAYRRFEGLEFPVEIIDIFYKEGEVMATQITTYSKIVLNATDENDIYDYVLPAHLLPQSTE